MIVVIKEAIHTRSLRAARGIALIAALALVSFGCDRSRPSASSPPPPPAPVLRGIWTNSLGMVFLPIPGSRTALSVWETRVADFAAFVDATGHDASDNFFYYVNRSWNRDNRSWRDPGFAQTPLHPVVGVSWRDAALFCSWLTEHERERGIISMRQAYRLPTNQEWTLAAGPERPVAENLGNYHDGLGIDPFEFTSPVGSFLPNLHGFYDMEGNTWEYCLDQETVREVFRVIRGGSWQNWHARFVGVNARGRCGLDVRITLYGFRIALANEDSRSMRMRLDAAEVADPPRPPPD
jgi:hypothetical protein